MIGRNVSTEWPEEILHPNAESDQDRYGADPEDGHGQRASERRRNGGGDDHVEIQPATGQENRQQTNQQRAGDGVSSLGERLAPGKRGL